MWALGTEPQILTESASISPWLGTYCVNQGGLKLRDLPVSISRVLGFKASATQCALHLFFMSYFVLNYKFLIYSKHKSCGIYAICKWFPVCESSTHFLDGIYPFDI